MISKPAAVPALAAPPTLAKADLIRLPLADRLASIDGHFFYTPDVGKAPPKIPDWEDVDQNVSPSVLIVLQKLM